MFLWIKFHIDWFTKDLEPCYGCNMIYPTPTHPKPVCQTELLLNLLVPLKFYFMICKYQILIQCLVILVKF